MKKIICIFLLTLLSINAKAYKSINFFSSTSKMSGTNLTGFSVGENSEIVKTTNGGSNWFHLSSGFNANFNSIIMVSDSLVFISGDSGLIIKSTDCGNNWASQSSGTTNNLNAILFKNILEGFTIGDGGVIRRTIDGGITWVSISSGTSENLNDISFYHRTGDSYLGAIVGNNGIVLISSGFGESWIPLSPPPSIPILTSVSISSPSSKSYSLIVSSNIGTIYKAKYMTFNWSSWSSINISSFPLNSIRFKNSSYGITAGNSGKIFRTINGASSWDLSAFIPGSSNLYSLCLINDLIGWAVGDNNTILKTNDAGITWSIQPINIKSINSNVPDKFNLEQNYPNPFNPATTIEFDIKKSTYVKLMFFDALGKLIFTLNEERLSPGTYQVKENFTNLPSGVYYYQLVTETFSQTKKMLLIK